MRTRTPHPARRSLLSANQAVLTAALLIACAVSQSQAQVIFIDVDKSAAPAPGNSAAAAGGVSRPARIHAAVARFLPKEKSGRLPGNISTNTTLPQLIAALGKHGQVNLLYLGDRFTDVGTNSLARFESLERRPAFALNADANRSLTNREFGLELRTGVRVIDDQRGELHWNGRFSWSPDLIDAWVGDKYLLFGMRVATVLKPGLVYYESDDDDSARGINIGGLFRKKPKPTNSVPDFSFLVAERRQVPLEGRQILRPGELSITAIPIPTNPKEPEVIYLVLHFSPAD